MRSSSPTSVGASLLVLRILHSVLMMSILMYGVIVYVITRQPMTERPPDAPMIQVALWAMSAVTLLVGVPLARLKMMPSRKPLELTEEPLPSPLPVEAQRALRRAFSASIVSWALCESVAVYGVVVGVTEHRLDPFFPFGAASLGSIALLVPTRRLLESVARAALGPNAN
jgi:hypothetical protein